MRTKQEWIADLGQLSRHERNDVRRTMEKRSRRYGIELPDRDDNEAEYIWALREGLQVERDKRRKALKATTRDLVSDLVYALEDHSCHTEFVGYGLADGLDGRAEDRPDRADATDDAEHEAKTEAWMAGFELARKYRDAP